MKELLGKPQLIKRNSYENWGNIDGDFNSMIKDDVQFTPFELQINFDYIDIAPQILTDTHSQAQINNDAKAQNINTHPIIVVPHPTIEVPVQKRISKKNNGKNFPKQVGNYLLKHLNLFPLQQIPIGIQRLKDNAEVMKQNGKQASFAIQDFRNACEDKASQEYLKDFLKNKLPLYLVHSPMIKNPTKLYGLIFNAYVGACNPQLWKGNSQVQLIE